MKKTEGQKFIDWLFKYPNKSLAQVRSRVNQIVRKTARRAASSPEVFRRSGPPCCSHTIDVKAVNRRIERSNKHKYRLK